ncbi:MFS general substrate transporter [Venustampulla echinocandica]|uniref:MFS general substrate transporter n=1 Tax=Venustampulla echinocandica TaxID=2656787 RepID=A0A370TYI5_9HELO|nr:MFS general substrate transporter [Venustampulla echinocandica]RDL40568.1 MFS general substrate transporter [Venustampulla echinocandica]
MTWGILEDNHMDLVPGTACMNDQSDVPHEYDQVPRAVLKHGTGRLAHVILVPQPTDSPNDPLNWSTWKKDGILLIVGFSAAVVGAFGPMLSPGFVEIAAEMNISVNTLSQATAWLIMTIGLSLFIMNPLAKVWGRRPVYIIAIVIMFACSIWGAFAKNYDSFLASRVVSGFGMAPYEVLVQCTIGDLYFVHERATRIALWNLFLLCGITGGSLVSGYIIEDIGWKWTFGICAVLFGVFIFLVILFVPETAYIRPPLQSRFVGTPVLASEVEKEKSDLPQKELTTTASHTPTTEPKEPYLRTLRFMTGRKYSTAPFWKILVRPAVIFWYPAVLWAFLIYGVTLTWIVVFSVVNAAIFTVAPYNFTVSQVGLISISPFIMTIIGEVIAGPLNDYICLWLAKKNHGIYEPEFRLVLMVPVFILGVAGFFGFGATVHFQTHWIGPVLTFGLANMSMAFANGCVFGYVIDSYEDLTEEGIVPFPLAPFTLSTLANKYAAFVAINARNLLTFGLTYFVNDWLAKDGVLQVFNVLGGTFVAVTGLTLPLWIFGKKLRSAVARNKFLVGFMRD